MLKSSLTNLVNIFLVQLYSNRRVRKFNYSYFIYVGSIKYNSNNDLDNTINNMITHFIRHKMST